MKRKLLSVLLAGCMVAALTACGNTSSTTTSDTATETSAATETPAESESEEAEAADEEVMHVVVACTGSYEPYNYVDENDELVGFDMDIIRAIDEASPEIECELTWVAWDSLLAGVDAGRFDMLSAQICYTDERAELYHMDPEPYMVSVQKLITNTDHADATSLDDFKDAKIATTVGTLQAEILENYLEEHPDYFEIVYYEGTLEYYLSDVSSGKVDATIEDPAVGLEKAKTLGLDNLITVGDSLDNSTVWFLYQNNENGAKIQEIVDKYYKQLLADGTISSIAEQYLGSNDPILKLNEMGYYEDVEIK